MPVVMEQLATGRVYTGNVIDIIPTFPPASIDLVVTSPPYYSARDYGSFPAVFGGDPACVHEFKVIDVLRKPTPGDKPSRKSKIAKRRGNDENRPAKPSEICGLCGAYRGNLGNEPSPALFVSHLCDIFDLVKRVLKPGGSVFVNIGDTYSGSVGVPPYEQKKGEKRPSKKNAMLIPQRFVIAMQERGWIVRNEAIWHKYPVSKPETVYDRFARSHEPIYFFTLSDDYYFETPMESGKGGRRVMRSVWSFSPSTYRSTHIAAFPPKLAAIPISVACPPGGVVLDIFIGSGSTAVAAVALKRQWVGIDVSPEYASIAGARLHEGLKNLDTWTEK
jgi:DNA modification methylase